MDAGEEQSADRLEARLSGKAGAAGIVIAPERLRDVVEGARRLEEGMVRVRGFLASFDAEGRR